MLTDPSLAQAGRLTSASVRLGIHPGSGGLGTSAGCWLSLTNNCRRFSGVPFAIVWLFYRPPACTTTDQQVLVCRSCSSRSRLPTMSENAHKNTRFLMTVHAGIDGGNGFGAVATLPRKPWRGFFWQDQ
jgi:hypothetical protein